MSRPLVRLPPLDLIKGFVAVGRRMSITQAAQDLCVTQSAISKQVRTLEDLLGVPLFHRGYRSVSFTEQGQRLYQVANGSIRQLQDVIDLVCAPRRQPVTLTASTSVASLWLLPRLGEFLGAHPEIDVRFSATNAVLELGGDVDLAIRYCPQQQAPRGATRLFGETVVPIASPALGLHLLDTLEPLRSATLLEFDVPGRPWLHWSDWLAARGWHPGSARAMLRFNQYEQTIQATLAGRGLALGRLELLQPYLEDGQLAVLDTPSHPPLPSPCAFWLVGADGAPRDEVRCVAEWILASARQTGSQAWAGLR